MIRVSGIDGILQVRINNKMREIAEVAQSANKAFRKEEILVHFGIRINSRSLS